MWAKSYENKCQCIMQMTLLCRNFVSLNKMLFEVSGALIRLRSNLCFGKFCYNEIYFQLRRKHGGGGEIFYILKIIQTDINGCHAFLVFVIMHQLLFCLHVYIRSTSFTTVCIFQAWGFKKFLGRGMAEDGPGIERRRKI